MLVFYGCYLVKMVRQRRSGITMDQSGRGKRGAAKVVELTANTASHLVLAAEVLSICLDICALPALERLLGAAAGALGSALFVVSMLTMGNSWQGWFR